MDWRAIGEQKRQSDYRLRDKHRRVPIDERVGCLVGIDAGGAGLVDTYQTVRISLPRDWLRRRVRGTPLGRQVLDSHSHEKQWNIKEFETPIFQAWKKSCIFIKFIKELKKNS